MMPKFFLLIFILIININRYKFGTVEQLSDDSKYFKLEYYSLFKIPTSIMTFFANGGEREGFELSKAFDNNWDTHWRSEGEQGEEYQNPKTGIKYNSLINHIIITFKKTVIIDKILYKTDNCKGCEGIGYPIKLNVFGKLKKNSDDVLDPYDDSDFILIDNITSEATQNRVMFFFEKSIKCDQIKIEWGEMKTYSPRFPKMTTAREIMFFYPETQFFNETILNLFLEEDYTQMVLNPEFHNLEIIEEIIDNNKELINFNDEVNNLLQRAKLAIAGGLKFDEKREFTTNQNADRNIIRQRGNILSHARNVLKMAMAGTNRQSTGIYALANETITIYATGDNSDPLPTIVFTQYIGHYSNWIGSSFNLVKGRQTYICDNFNVNSYEIKVKSGGPIYIINPYTSDEQSQNVKIYIEGGTLFPSFRLGENEDEYKSFLSEYVLIYKNNEDTYLDITELFGYRTMITIQATLANDIYQNSNKGPLVNLNTWDEYIKKLFIYDGIQYNNSEPYYDIKNTYVNLHIRYAQPFGAAYASSEHIGIFSSGWFGTAIYAESYGWGFAHEIGHTMDVNERTVSENTNNMISKYDETYLRKEGSRGEFSESLKALTLDDIDVYKRGCSNDSDDTCKGFFTNLQLNFLVYWYLESFYPGYWGKLDNMYRYNYTLSSGMSRTERFIVFSNLISGIDLGYYFHRWGFFLNNEGIFNPNGASLIYQKAMEGYINNGTIDNATQLKFWYLDYKEYLYKIEGGEGCYEDQINDYDIQIKNVFYINNTRTILLLPEIKCKGHLGFEIYEHNKLIGFTYDYFFIDTKNYENDYNQEYSIIAFDRKLLQSKKSNIKIRDNNLEVCSFNSIFFNSIKDAVKYAENLNTDNDLNIYLLKNTYESNIQINKKINIYLGEESENIIIYKIDDGILFDIQSGATLNIQGKNENNRIILDGMNMPHKGNLLFGYNGAFTGNYLSFQNNNNTETNGGGAIWVQSCTFQLNNSLIYNNYGSYGGGYYGQKVSLDMKATFINVVFDSNKATIGGAIRNTGLVNLINSNIKNCVSSNNGGGISNDNGGELNIKEGIINNNTAINNGGGLFLDGFTTLNSVKIIDNIANYGAGIAYSGGNNRRIVTINNGTIIKGNNAIHFGGGLYVIQGTLNILDSEIYNNKINENEGLLTSNHSDLFLVQNGVININGAKMSGCIFKSDSALIYLKSALLKYNDNDESKIYIDFINNGYNKTLFSGSNYIITSNDLNNVNLIDSNEGILSLNDFGESNSLIFTPNILSISFNLMKISSSFLVSLLLDKDDDKEIFYYGKEIILSDELFPIEENEYIIRLYDDKGKNYTVGQTLKLVDNISFFYEIGYKIKIIFDMIDYQEIKYLIPNEIIYLPSFRKDFSTTKIILYWKDEETGEIFKKYEKLIGDKNRTLIAVYSGEYYPVKIIMFNSQQINQLLKYGDNLNFPLVDIPNNIHFIGWRDQLSNKEYDINVKNIAIKKEYLFKGIYVSYVYYYINNELVYKKEYELNSSFSLLDNSEFSKKKILYWKDEKSNIEYNYGKNYYINHDIDLYAVFEESENKSNTLLIIIIIIAFLFLLITAFFICRYIKRKNLSKKETNDKENLKDLFIINL